MRRYLTQHQLVVRLQMAVVHKVMAWKTRVIDLLLLRFEPSSTALLDWLHSHIDDTMLHEIAAADYGHREQENFQALRNIYESLEIPAPLPWNPREVLELTRWSEPDDSQQTWSSTGTRGHLIRAFCCAILLKAADAPETLVFIHAENDTLAQLLASVLQLGREASESALHFLSWRIQRLPGYDAEYPFFALGLLLLRAALFEPGQEGADLKLLADWVMREEARARRMCAIVESEAWLLGLTNFDQRHKVWRRLAQEKLLDPTKHFPKPTASAMREIVKHLAPGLE
jgi:hypothetical protein